MFPFYDNYMHVGDMCFPFMITICNGNVYLQPTGTAVVAQWVKVLTLLSGRLGVQPR